MYHVSAQDVDERMINVHYYYYYSAFSPLLFLPDSFCLRSSRSNYNTPSVNYLLFLFLLFSVCQIHSYSFFFIEG